MILFSLYLYLQHIAVQAVPPDPAHLFRENVKIDKLATIAAIAKNFLVSTGKPGLYLKFEISAGYLQ